LLIAINFFARGHALLSVVLP